MTVSRREARRKSALDTRNVQVRYPTSALVLFTGPTKDCASHVLH
jgi:hypothetical protein